MQMENNKEAFPILVVDDSAVARKLVEHTLPEDQFELILAKTGREALELFAEHRPGLIITDWLMPDLSGVEVCERIRADFSDSFTYIILLTGISEKEEIVKGLQSGADEFLTKPFDPAELRARIGVGRRIVELHRELEANNRLLEQLSLTDSLTGLPNRRAIEEWAKHQLNSAARHDFPLWVIMTDLDKFKSINDTYGHEAGDVVLKGFAETLNSHSRQCDITGRLGGDEFLLVMTHAGATGAQLAIERIREQVEAKKFDFRGNSIGVTASFGIAGFQRGQETDFERLVVRADAALYAAKRQGGNRIEMLPIETS
jgi:two-component system chemotaxis response regulator CheY